MKTTRTISVVASVLAVGLFLLVLAPILGLNRSASPAQIETLYPSDYSSAKQTEEVSARQTDEAYALTPASPTDGGLFPLFPTSGAHFVEPVGIVAGNGILVTSQFGWPTGISPQGFALNNAWYQALGKVVC